MKTSMKTVATVLAVALGVAGSATAAMADYRIGPNGRSLPATTWDGLSTGSIAAPDAGYSFGGCQRSSAQEGNADQQHFPVKQYGQTAGGYRC